MRTVQISSSPKLWTGKYNVTSINVSRIRIHPFNLAYDHSKYESHYTMQIMHVLEKKTSYKAYDKSPQYIWHEAAFICHNRLAIFPNPFPISNSSVLLSINQKSTDLLS